MKNINKDFTSAPDPNSQSRQQIFPQYSYWHEACPNSLPHPLLVYFRAGAVRQARELGQFVHKIGPYLLPP